MRVMIFGGNGLLGHKLVGVFSGDRDLEVSATFRASPLYDRADCLLIPNVDAKDLERVERVLSIVKPDVAINAIGIVKQRVRSTDFIRINSVFPRRLGALCNERNIRLIHFSTDCVFKGDQGNYRESDIAQPEAEDVYGWSKLQGELSQANALTLRMSVIGWELENFLSLTGWFAGQRGKVVKGYSRAFFSGLTSESLADAVKRIVKDYQSLNGLYHVSGERISKCELLIKLRDLLKWKIEIIPDSALERDTSLNSERFTSITKWKAPSWDAMLEGLASEWQRYKGLYE